MSSALIPSPEQARPVDWNKELDGAKMLLKSGLLPNSVKSPEAALFIILAGRDLGLSPVQSLRSINIIQGKVEVAADMQLGLFHRAGGKSRWMNLTNEEAILQLVAPWLIEPHIERFMLDDAKRAKLAGDNWQKYPKAMLRSRAITAGLKSVGFDPTAGVYDYGEIGGPEPVITAEEAETGISPVVVQSDDKEDDTVLSAKEVEAIESGVRSIARENAALKDLEELLPSLPINQQDYVRGKLSDGADPVALFEATKERALRKLKRDMARAEE